MQHKVYTAGTCRVLQPVRHLPERIESITSMVFKGFTGRNFLAKIHSTKQHVQMLAHILGDIDIPVECHRYIYSVCNPLIKPEWERDDLTTSLASLREEINSVEALILEVSSVKNFRNNAGLYYNMELIDVEPNKPATTATTAMMVSMLEDIWLIRRMLPGKALLLACHFRPQLLDPTKASVAVRELIFKTLKVASETIPSVYMLDPNDVVVACGVDKVLGPDRLHWTEEGQWIWAEYIAETLDLIPLVEYI